MPNINGIMRKLQKAIINSGFIVTLNTEQFYSYDQKRTITMYVLSTPIYANIRGEWRDTKYEIIRTASGPDTLQCMADIYKAVKAWAS